MKNSLDKLLSLLTRLNARNINYHLEQYRADAISIIIAVPGERWEIDFFPDRPMGVERFVNPSGDINDESSLEDLFSRFGEDTEDKGK